MLALIKYMNGVTLAAWRRFCHVGVGGNARVICRATHFMQLKYAYIRAKGLIIHTLSTPQLSVPFKF